MRSYRTLAPQAFGALVAFALTAAACTSGSDTVGSTGNSVTDLDRDDISLTSGLETVADCDALLARLIEEGVERVGPYGFGQGGHPVIMEDAVMESATADGGGSDRDLAAASPESEASSSGSNDFTGTNVQEAGVDEPDLVKTDGSTMVVAAAGKLQILNVSGATPTLAKTVSLPQDQWATDLFLVGGRAFLTTSGWTEVAFSSTTDSMPRWGGGVPTTRILEVDLASGDIVRTLEFEGTQISAREIDGTIRFVVSAATGSFPFLFPSSPEAEASAEKANQDILRNSTIDQWLPSYRLLQGATVVEQGRMIDCDRFHLPADFSGFGTVAVLTVDANAGLVPLDALAVLTDGQTIYASTSRLTVATQRWPEWRPDGSVAPDTNFTASLHNFDITDPTVASYTGSGSVRGHLLSQYSMSEHDGYLRVATTDGDPWGASQSSESFVTVFDEQDGRLVQVGQVGGLGKTEQIYAVRFLGAQAFVVTFRQTDPLYSIDLSDPANPRIAGELKIPGYSSYLHPVGDGTLIGVGQEADDNGATQGSQISVFDTSNPANPRRLSQLLFGSGTYSAVEGDPRAFTWLAEGRLALVPVSWWGWDDRTQTDNSGSAAVIVRVGEDGSLTELGRIDHPATEYCEPGVKPLVGDAVEGNTVEGATVEEADPSNGTSSSVAPDGGYCSNFRPEIRRTVVIGETLYTISEGGVKANVLDTLAETAWIPFS